MPQMHYTLFCQPIHLYPHAENTFFQFVFVFMSTSADRIAECIKQKLPYADVFPADSEDEIVKNLTEVPPPIQFKTSIEVGGEEFTAPNTVGCFIGGAGTNITQQTYTLVHVHMYMNIHTCRTMHVHHENLICEYSALLGTQAKHT